jgi:polar amino acid transport system substrate-binding protein
MSDETLPTLRFAINLGNAVLASLTPDGQPAGITVELAKDIARHLHCRPEFITYPAAGKVVEDAGQDVWDIAFLAIDPKREDRLRFTSPYITIKGTLLVREQSDWRSVSDMDKPGVVINVGKNAAYDLWLSRELHHATLNRLSSSQAAIDAFLAGKVRWPPVFASRLRPQPKTIQAFACCRMISPKFNRPSAWQKPMIGILMP